MLKWTKYGGDRRPRIPDSVCYRDGSNISNRVAIPSSLVNEIELFQYSSFKPGNFSTPRVLRIKTETKEKDSENNHQQSELLQDQTYTRPLSPCVEQSDKISLSSSVEAETAIFSKPSKEHAISCQVYHDNNEVKTLKVSESSESSSEAKVFLRLEEGAGTERQTGLPKFTLKFDQHHTKLQKMASAMPDVTNPSSSSIEDTSLGPEVEWEKEDIKMSEMADINTFPCICQYEEEIMVNGDGYRVPLDPGVKIYSRQPVLMYMRAKKYQARARTIFKDKSGSYYELGQTLIIPQDYQGLFEVVPSDFSRATCYMSIGEVAKVMPDKFFTRSNVKGIRLESDGDKQKYLERKIPAGSVLGTKGTFKAKWKTRADTGLFKKKTTEWELKEVEYLKCIDADGSEILVPLTHKGKFNAIYEKGQLSQNAVYTMKDILSDLSLPVKVRLLFGKAPVVPCIFTGMLIIRSAVVDDVIVGSTILNKRNVLFEIPSEANVKVNYTSSESQFAESKTFKDAQKLCKRYAKLFSTMIKLSTNNDTDQKVILHVPNDPSMMKQADEVLRALDLITDISFGDEPKDHLLDSSDSGSMSSSEDHGLLPKGGQLSELSEYKSQESQTHV